MAARATWKGFLKVSLVNIPIKVFPATESGAMIAFKQLHGECRTHIQQQQKKWCPHCEREVSSTDVVKGYEFAKGQYVVVSEEEDFDKVRTESTRVIDLVQLASESAIDPMCVDRTYYLAPDGPVAGEAFAVMRDGMAGKVGVGKLKAIIDARIAGEEIVTPAVEAPAKVVNLREALRKSLDAVSAGKKRPAKAEATKAAKHAAVAKSASSAPNKRARA